MNKDLENSEWDERVHVPPLLGVPEEQRVASGPVRWFRRLREKTGNRPFSGMEWTGIQPIKPEDRVQRNYFAPAFVYFSANMNSMIAPTLGLGLRASMYTIVGFIVPCGLFPAYFITFGPQLGMRQMVQSRYSFGYFGGCLVALLNAMTGCGYIILNAILGGETLQAVSPHQSMSATVGIVIIVLVGLCISFFGIRVLHWAEMVLWIPILISFVIMVGETKTGPEGLHTIAEEPAPTSRAILSMGCILAGFQMSYAASVSDVSMYVRPQISSWKLFFAAFGTFTLGSTPILLLGAAFASSAQTIPAWSEALADNPSPGPLIDLILSHKLGNFGKFLTVLLALSAMGNIMTTLYSIGITFQTALPALMYFPRFVMPILATAVVLPLAIVGKNSFYDTLTNFISMIAYWTVLYVGVVMADHVFLRRGDFRSYDPAIYNQWSQLPLGVAALSASILSLGLVIPLMDQEWYTGPLAKHVGDLGFEVGLVMSFVLYLILRPIEKRIAGR
ncbi:hypothetical protein MYAM1_004047 [Malassezia yamatoensis]|uniref:Purine-cytosine permease n=1 Tax=Malassezia yamatoensis TaxID=253288 RepID=A0AAJ5YVS2_9BASI|nr:hypothetical protein MYAM1_004047 [Malassezia yamatoensis]